jgi:hypothetical protein
VPVSDVIFCLIYTSFVYPQVNSIQKRVDNYILLTLLDTKNTFTEILVPGIGIFGFYFKKRFFSKIKSLFK